MKCPMPAYKGDEKAFVHVSLEITMNGFDFKKFNCGF